MRSREKSILFLFAVSVTFHGNMYFEYVHSFATAKDNGSF